MPLYGQHNVSAGLLVSELSASLTRQLQLRMGKQFNSDSAAISETLLRGDLLAEDPLYSSMDGDCIHLGTNNDKACLVVAVHHEPPAPTEAPRVSDLALSLKVVAPIRGSEFDDVRSIKRPKDLKIETFLNGQLLDVTSRKCRRPSNRTVTDDETDIISGLRFHRQTEKPLVYRSNHSVSTNPSGNSSSQRRWLEANKAVALHAQRIGFRSHDQRPPSCDYLMGLSELPLNMDLAQRAPNYAILDVVITTGKKTVGNLSAPCIKIPTILKDPTCTPQDIEVDSVHETSEEKTKSVGGKGRANIYDASPHSDASPAICFADTLLVSPIDEQDSGPIDLVERPQTIIYDEFDRQYSVHDQIDHEHNLYWHEPIDRYVHSPVVQSLLGAAPRTTTSLQYSMLSPPRDQLDHELDSPIDPELLHTHPVQHGKMIELRAPLDDNLVTLSTEVMQPRPLHAAPLASIVSVMDSDTFMPTTPDSSRMEHTPDTSPTRYYTAYQNLEGTHFNTGNEMIALGTPTRFDVFEMDGFGPSPGLDVFNTIPARFVTAQSSPHQDQTLFDGIQAPQYMSPISEVAKAMDKSQLASPCGGLAKRSWSEANNLSDEHYDLNISTDAEENDGSPRLVASAPSGATYSIKSIKKTCGRLFGTESGHHGKTRSGRRKHRTNDDKPDLTGSPVRRGANRTAKRWDPDEQTVEEALAAFQIPESCENSAVTFAGGSAMRQIPKAREAEFIKDGFVVGMRFIVF